MSLGIYYRNFTKCYQMNLKPPFIASIFGSPGSGKSHLCKYLAIKLHQQKLIDLVIACTGTPFNDFFQEFINPAHIHRFSRELIQKILKKAEELRPNNIKILLILDDLLGSANWNIAEINQLFTCHRHYNISILLTSQYPNKIPPTIRECSWIAIVFPQTTDISINALYLSFGSGFATKRDFATYLKTLPKHSFVCIDNKVAEFDLKYKKMKAPDKIPKVFIRNLIK